MSKRVGVDLTRAARLIGVKRGALIIKLLSENVLARNNEGSLIAHSRMTKLHYFYNDLVHPQNKKYLPPVEVLKVTVAGMEFLRDFCAQNSIEPRQSEKPIIAGPEQLSIQGKLARKQCLDMARECGQQAGSA